MFVAEIRFPLSPDRTPDACEAVTDLLATWLKNGQIEVDWQLVEDEREFVAIALIPEEGSLDAIHANRYVAAAMEAVAKRGVFTPSVAVRGSSPDFDPACACTRSGSLVLFTNLYSKASPVRCGGCFMPVPLYRLPHTQGAEYLDVLHWAADYRACDTLQMHCTTGERFGEKQLADHDSSLSRQGRAIAGAMAAATGIPVYYHLFKARGRSRATELARRCPGCDGAWLLSEPWHRQFAFRCDACRLVSNVACSLRA